VTGKCAALAPVLAAHDDVDAIWFFGSASGAAEVEKLSTGNMKRTWTQSLERGWFDPVTGEGHEFLREATQVKNIWTPSGE
jgi:aldehyde dehydrogenase (NAD+)